MLFFKGKNSKSGSNSPKTRLCGKKRSLCFEPLERRDLLSLPATGADLEVLESRGFSSNAESGTIFITTLEDKVDANDGLISLREAVDYANNTGTHIEFEAFGTIFLKGKLSINKSLTINAPGKQTITLDGSKSSADSCFIEISAYTSLSEMAVSFQNISFKNCKNTSNGGSVSVGAYCNAIFENCFFLNNTSLADGGAVFFEGRGSFSNTVVQNNSAVNGGAIALGGSSNYQTIIDSSVFKNNSASQKGGTLYCNGQGSYEFSSLSESPLLKIKGSEVSNSSAIEGGAFWFDNAFCSISDTLLTKNQATEKGGGIFIGDYGFLLIELSTLDSNTAETGGALFNSNVLYSNGNTYSRNSAISSSSSELGGSGGAITSCYLLSSRGDQIRENSASDRGAGLMNYFYIDKDRVTIYGQCQLIDVALENNRSVKEGGAVYNYGEIVLSNSIVSGNSGSGGGGFYCLNGSTLNISQSVFTDNIAASTSGTGGGIDNCGTLVISGSSFINNQAGVYSNQTGSGGAVNNNYHGKLTVSNSRFIANTAYKGGAIYDFAAKDSADGMENVEITGSTFQRNCDSSNSGFESENYPLDDTNTQSGNITTQNTFSDSLVLYDAYGNIVSGSINFGAITQSDGSCDYTYKIINQSSNTVQISKTDSFSGTGISWTLEKNTNVLLAPGESIKLTLTISPKTLGPSSIYISLTLADNTVFQINTALAVVESAAIVSASEITLSTESSSGAYTLKLNQAPVSDVKVIITAPEGMISDTTELIFTKDNYNTPQTVSFHWDAGKLADLDEPLEKAFLSHILVYDIDNSTDQKALEGLMIPDKEINLSYTIAVPGSSDPAAIEPKTPEMLIADTYTYGGNNEVLKIVVNVPDADGISNWQIDWGDGSIENNFYLSSRIKTAHYYSAQGNYSIILRMFDKSGKSLENIYYLGNHTVFDPVSPSMVPDSSPSNDNSLAVIESVLENWNEEGSEADSVAESLVPCAIDYQAELYSIFSSDFLTEKNKKSCLFSGEFLDF
ncbi:MAG: CSLREA domain-containing protein [Planctomycetia bacterium]|nr:CSLREA domain-containing protein [Planctomycetia bacterium]